MSSRILQIWQLPFFISTFLWGRFKWMFFNTLLQIRANRFKRCRPSKCCIVQLWIMCLECWWNQTPLYGCELPVSPFTMRDYGSWRMYGRTHPWSHCCRHLYSGCALSHFSSGNKETCHTREKQEVHKLHCLCFHFFRNVSYRKFRAN